MLLYDYGLEEGEYDKRDESSYTYVPEPTKEFFFHFITFPKIDSCIVLKLSGGGHFMTLPVRYESLPSGISPNRSM